MSSFEAIAEIRKDENTGYIPVIFISAVFQDIASKFKSLEVSGYDHLLLPIDPEELLFKVKANLQTKILIDNLSHTAYPVETNLELRRQAEERIALGTVDIQRVSQSV